MDWVKKILDLRIKTKPRSLFCILFFQEMEEGEGALAADDEKRSPNDFALWKTLGLQRQFCNNGNLKSKSPVPGGPWSLQGNRSQVSQLGQVSGDQADQASPATVFSCFSWVSFVGWKARMVLGLISGFSQDGTSNALSWQPTRMVHTWTFMQEVKQNWKSGRWDELL